MPAQAMTTDTATTAPPYADVLDRREPPRSATSDMPQGAEETTEDTPVDNTETVADVADTSTAKPADGEADGKPPIPGEGPDETPAWLKARITRETNKIRRAAEEQTADLKATVQQLVETVTKLTAPPPPKEAARPTRETFDSPEAYDDALIKWSDAKARAEATETAKADQAKTEQQRQSDAVQSAYNDRVEAFADEHPDYEETVMKPDLFTNPVMGQTIKEADDGPEIAYYLAQHKDEHDRISKLSPMKVIYEIGRISTKLAAPPTPAPAPKPKPISPIRARNNSGDKDPADMTTAEYNVYWKNRADNRPN